MSNYSTFQSNKEIKMSQKVVNGLHIELTPLAENFFSKHNMDNIHFMLIQEVKKEGYDIDKQSDRELEIVMRSIYLQNPVDTNLNLNQQLSFLNNLIIQDCLPKIITEVKQYLGYLESLDQNNYKPLNYPKASKGKQSIVHPYLRDF